MILLISLSSSCICSTIPLLPLPCKECSSRSRRSLRVVLLGLVWRVIFLFFEVGYTHYSQSGANDEFEGGIYVFIDGYVFHECVQNYEAIDMYDDEQDESSTGDAFVFADDT